MAMDVATSTDDGRRGHVEVEVVPMKAKRGKCMRGEGDYSTNVGTLTQLGAIDHS